MAKSIKTLLIATRNKGKFNEFVGILKDLPFKLIFLNDLPRFLDSSTSEVDYSRNLGTCSISKAKLFNNVKETGSTFEENAVLKAKTYGKMSGLLTLADDSGLCVDYLDGGPGVKSRRFSSGNDKDRYQKLLKIMEKMPKKDRKAKFISVICLYNPQNRNIIITSGECPGEIAFKPKGKHGFGFDPVFIVEGLDKHFAELTLEEKNQVSHRAKALKKIKKFL